MADPVEQPTWVPRLVVDAIHHDQLLEHGGRRGIRDVNALSAALARPEQRKHYEPQSDLAALAAAYAFGIATGHPYTDGNKRVAFVVAAVFLGLNGYTLHFTDAQVVETMLAVAAGTMTEESLAAWFLSSDP